MGKYENQKPLELLKGLLVARAGIEPATQGFSVEIGSLLSSQKTL
jgi:hypothetical protein